MPDEGGGHGGTCAGGAAAPNRAARWWYRAVALIGAAGIGCVSTLVGSSLLHDDPATAELPEMPVTGLRMLAVGSWVRIHPARAPQLCVSEGRDRTGHYETAVAVQRSCTQPSSPRVFLEPVGRDLVQIQWHHPRDGVGCLTVLPTGPGRNLLEPRDDCAETDGAQQFRVESFGPPAAGRFRIRPAGTGQCLSLRNQDTAIGAEITQGRCSGAAPAPPTRTS